MTKEGFLSLLSNIRRVAMERGYAIGIHGSMERDFDLIAAPWTDSAVTADELAEALFVAVRAKRWRSWEKSAAQDATNKPHGRRSYQFDWDETNQNYGYVDLSVMPVKEPDVPQA